MAKTRRAFTPVFDPEAVALLGNGGRSQMQIAAELRIQPVLLRQWRTGLMEVSPQRRLAGSPGLATMSPVISPSDHG